jgi:uncharacterized membrane protein YdjX (TVP38/TMEM64 family)
MRKLVSVAVSVMVIGALATLVLRVDGVADTCVAVAHWLREQRWLGVLAFAGVYLVATLVLFPHVALTIAAGFAYGALAGAALAVAASFVSAIAAFALGRTVLGGMVERYFQADHRAAELDRAARARGLWVVMLVRLAPLLPFAAINYLFAMTGIRWRDYVIGSAIGMTPWTIVYAYLGAIAPDAARVIEGHGPIAVPIVGGALGVAASIVLSVMAKRALGGRFAA